LYFWTAHNKFGDEAGLYIEKEEAESTELVGVASLHK
jgi:hypothetical protein